MSTLTFAEACRITYEELKLRRKHRYILFKMDDDNTIIDVECTGERASSLDEFKSKLPDRDCRFGIFDQEKMSDRGVLVNKLWLVIWIPHNSSASKKMQYTAAKSRFAEAVLPGSFETQAATLDELMVSLGLMKEEIEKDEDFDF